LEDILDGGWEEKGRRSWWLGCDEANLKMEVEDVMGGTTIRCRDMLKDIVFFLVVVDVVVGRE